MEEIKLTDVPYGDSIYVIYYIKGKLNPKIYHTISPLLNDKQEFYEQTFQDIFNEIENKENGKISHCMIIAESGLDGVVYRYNNYSDGKIYECGTTRGYA